MYALRPPGTSTVLVLIRYRHPRTVLVRVLYEYKAESQKTTINEPKQQQQTERVLVRYLLTLPCSLPTPPARACRLILLQSSTVILTVRIRVLVLVHCWMVQFDLIHDYRLL